MGGGRGRKGCNLLIDVKRDHCDGSDHTTQYCTADTHRDGYSYCTRCIYMYMYMYMIVVHTKI